jgi:hypothetical protein
LGVQKRQLKSPRSYFGAISGDYKPVKKYPLYSRRAIIAMNAIIIKKLSVIHIQSVFINTNPHMVNHAGIVRQTD